MRARDDELKFRRTNNKFQGNTSQASQAEGRVGRERTETGGEIEVEEEKRCGTSIKIVVERGDGGKNI